MTDIDSFQTKRGVARFSEDAILFEESLWGYLRSLHRGYWQCNEWWRKAVFVCYPLAILFGVGWVFVMLWQGRVLPIAAVAAILLGLWLVNYLRGFRSADRVSLDSITSVSATRGEMALTRPRLVLTYSEGRTTNKRRINLPSLYSADGEETFKRARRAFEERGFQIQ